MKIAICLYGVTPFETKKYENYEPYRTAIDNFYTVDGFNYHSLKSWKENIINHNDVDFFIHSWTENEQHKEKLLQVFNPKKYEFNSLVYQDSVISSSLSVKNVLSILDSYETENSFTYDLVLICRMDLVWFRPIDIKSTYDVNKFTVTYWGIRDIEPNKTWDDPYEGNKHGTHDVIFASNSKNAKLYSTLFDYIDEYRKNESDLTSHHTIKRYHIEKTGLISIIDHKLIVNKDLEIESRCSTHNNDFVNYIKKYN
jgi:hypothetical protein